MLCWQPHHQGFLCAECADDYKAIDGECTLCDKVDYHWIFTEGVVAILIGLFLLTKTFKSVCKPADANAVWEAAIDAALGCGTCATVTASGPCRRPRRVGVIARL